MLNAFTYYNQMFDYSTNININRVILKEFLNEMITAEKIRRERFERIEGEYDTAFVQYK